MSIRITALYIVIASLCIYAWKDWFKSLCGLFVMMALLQHGDMPSGLLGIQGINLWNILFGGIFLAWLASRRREGLRWDMPRHIIVLLLMYFVVILVGVMRAVLDRSYIQNYPLTNLISEELINTVKWVLPGILLFDGCRTRKRVIMALGCLVVTYLLLSVMVARNVSPRAVLTASGFADYGPGKLGKHIGYNGCDLSTMFAGASWAVLAALPLVRQRKYRFMTIAAAGMVAYAQALTGGRAGYLAWGATGLVLCLLKWRKYLILAPLLVILLPIVLPGVVDRMLTGFGETNVAGESTADNRKITSGRSVAWPYVIDKICESPVVGYGRLAMRRTGTYQLIETEHPGTGTPHPHNMYLETLLDNGILGSLPIFLFWGTVITYSARLFRSENRLCSAVGGLALSLTLSQLFGGIGSQHFYPRESTFGMWTAIFLSLRVYAEQEQLQTNAVHVAESWKGRSLQQQTAITFDNAL